MELRPERSDTALVIVDVQERLAAVMPREVLDRAVKGWVTLIEMTAVLKLPVAISEQYPKGLGPTVPILKEAARKVMPPARYLEKVDFSCCEAPLFDLFLGGGRRTLIVCGMETHICVYQTVRDLVGRGYNVQVPLDACVSRKKLDWQVGGALMGRAGATLTTTETLLFDLVKRAQGEEFRALSRLVKWTSAARRASSNSAATTIEGARRQHAPAPKSQLRRALGLQRAVIPMSGDRRPGRAEVEVGVAGYARQLRHTPPSVHEGFRVGLHWRGVGRRRSRAGAAGVAVWLRWWCRRRQYAVRPHRHGSPLVS